MTASDSNRTKEELSKCILKTASQLFKEHGVEAVSMHQIAKCAGVGQGTLYRRFANKADLCYGMMKDNFDQLQFEINQFLQGASDESFYNRIKGIISILIQFLDGKSHMLGVIQAEQLMERNKADFCESPPYLFMHGLLSGLLEEARRGKELKPDADSGFIAHTYIAMLSPHIYRHLVQSKGYTKDAVFETFCATYVDPLFNKN